MDPTASIIAIVDKAWVIVKYLRGVKQGSQERRILALEVSGVHAVTANLQAHLSREGWDSDTPWTRSIRPLLSKDGVLDQLRSTLVQIADKLAVNPGARLARTAQALKWPFEKKEVQDLVDRIQRLKSDINQALTQANLEISKETNTGVSYLRNCAEEEEFKTVTAWLCSLDARVIQSSEQKQPIKGTGQWFLHDPRFQAWTQGRSPVLWCHGIPGAGKTMLASAAFNHMAEHARGSDVARLIVFCSFDEQRTHTALDILSSLLRQTVELQGRLDDGIKKLYTYHVGTQKPSKPDVDKVHACLDKHLARFKDTFIILDGLDEMPKAEERSSILQQLERLSPRLKLLVTSRPLPQIRKWFVEHGLSEGFHISPKNLDSDEGPRYCDKYHQYNQRSLAIYQCPGCQQGFCATCFDTMNRCDKCNTEKEQWLSVFGKALTIVAAPDDLERYINWRIDGSHTLRRYISTLRRKGRDLRQEIVLKVQRYAQKMFLLAKFHLNVLVERTSPREVLDALETLPQEINIVYDKVFERIDQLPDATIVKNFITMIAAAETKFSASELENALAIREGDDYLDEYNLPDAAHLALLCAGLVDVDNSGYVSLAHETVIYYLRQNSSGRLPDGHSALATACLTYLSFPEFSKGACKGPDRYTALRTRASEHPLLPYASMHWGSHVLARDAERLMPLVVRFLSQDKNVESSVQLLCYDYSPQSNSWDAEEGANGLHLAAHFGIIPAASQLLASGVDVDVLDCMGTTPLMYAAVGGHADMVELLLHANADPGIVCERGETALHRACRGGHETVVQQLTRSPRDIAINALDPQSDFCSALMLAAEKSPVMTELLCSRWDIDVNLTSSDRNGRTALHHAAEENRVECVRVLFEHPEVNIDASDNMAYTPLISAASKGLASVVRALLEAGADSSACDSFGVTALQNAIINDQLACVRALVEHEADCYLKDCLGGGILHAAARHEGSVVLRYLLETVPDLDPNAQDKRGKTPLRAAVSWDSLESVRVLLDYGARTDVADDAGMTPARAARERPSLRCLPILREARLREVEARGPVQGGDVLQGDAESALRRVGSFADDFKPSIHSAVRTLGVEALNAALEAYGPNLSEAAHKVDCDTMWTPLHIAANLGKTKAVEKLLDANAAVINETDLLGRTALHLAARKGHTDVARQLLDRGADVNAEDLYQQIPLVYSRFDPQPELAYLLVKAGAHPDRISSGLQWLLSNAAKDGELEVVRRLVKAGVPFQAKRRDGRTPYQLAVESGHREIAELLDAEAMRARSLKPTSSSSSSAVVPTCDDEAHAADKDPEPDRQDDIAQQPDHAGEDTEVSGDATEGDVRVHQGDSDAEDLAVVSPPDVPAADKAVRVAAAQGRVGRSGSHSQWSVSPRELGLLAIIFLLLAVLLVK